MMIRVVDSEAQTFFWRESDKKWTDEWKVQTVNVRTDQVIASDVSRVHESSCSRYSHMHEDSFMFTSFSGCHRSGSALDCKLHFHSFSSFHLVVEKSSNHVVSFHMIRNYYATLWARWDPIIIMMEMTFGDVYILWANAHLRWRRLFKRDSWRWSRDQMMSLGCSENDPDHLILQLMIVSWKYSSSVIIKLEWIFLHYVIITIKVLPTIRKKELSRRLLELLITLFMNKHLLHDLMTWHIDFFVILFLPFFPSSRLNWYIWKKSAYSMARRWLHVTLDAVFLIMTGIPNVMITMQHHVKMHDLIWCSTRGKKRKWLILTTSGLISFSCLRCMFFRLSCRIIMHSFFRILCFLPSLHFPLTRLLLHSHKYSPAALKFGMKTWWCHGKKSFNEFHFHHLPAAAIMKHDRRFFECVLRW